MAARKASAKSNEGVVIQAPNYRIVRVAVRGTSQFVSNNFSEEARQMLKESMEKGQVDKKRGNKLPPKDFEKGYEGSKHLSVDGWCGIPCIAFKAAMVRAGSLVGVEMTKAKQCIEILADGVATHGSGLVRITSGEPERFDAYVRNSNGSPDIRARARFPAGWEATVTIRYDADFLSASSVINLLARAGWSVGVGAGRPFSTMSVGQGWGTFEVVTDDEKKEAAE